MIVLMNVKITDIRVGYPYDMGRGPWIPKSNRFDIFKYCLASYSVMDPLVTKYYFYITLEDHFAERRDELEEYIRDLFPEEKLVLNWNRNNYTSDWRKVCEDHLHDDDQIMWFAGNDDHIFMDYNLDMVESAIKTLQAESDPLAVVYYSHWPEQVRMSHILGGTPTEDGNFIKFNWDNFDGIHMFKVARFKRYWYDADYGKDMVFRPDDLHNHYRYTLPSVYYAPTREMVRHYDGYVHTGTEVTNHAPALFIPPNFFSNDMTLKFGFAERDRTCTNCNPMIPNLYNVDPNGTDYKFVEEDIPLFWKSHIAEIVMSDDYNKSAMTQARDRAIIDMTRFKISCFQKSFDHRNAPPVEWFTKHLRYKTP